MAMFGSNWNNDNDRNYDGLFSRWSDRTWKEDIVDIPSKKSKYVDEILDIVDIPSKKSKSVDEILDGIDISLIEKYLRKKKLKNLNKDERK